MQGHCDPPPQLRRKCGVVFGGSKSTDVCGSKIIDHEGDDETGPEAFQDEFNILIHDFDQREDCLSGYGGCTGRVSPSPRRIHLEQHETQEGKGLSKEPCVIMFQTSRYALPSDRENEGIKGTRQLNGMCNDHAITREKRGATIGGERECERDKSGLSALPDVDHDERRRCKRSIFTFWPQR